MLSREKRKLHIDQAAWCVGSSVVATLRSGASSESAHRRRARRIVEYSPIFSKKPERRCENFCRMFPQRKISAVPHRKER